MDWQLAIVVILVTAAGAYVVQRAIRAIARRSCCPSGCTTKPKNETLITLNVRKSEPEEFATAINRPH